jgi:hypothetical protein
MSDAELVFLRWTYKLEEKGDDEGVKRLDVRQYGEHGVAHEASGGRHDTGRVGRQAYAQPGSDWTTAGQKKLPTSRIYLTFENHAVRGGDQSPSVGRPVGMVQPSGEREEAAPELRKLSHEGKRAHRHSKHADHGVCERQEAHGLHLVRRRQTKRP